jgi:DNA-binding transcriptional MerR regulator
MNSQQRKLILETMETMLEVQLKSIRKILGKEDTQDTQVDVVRRRGRKRKSLAHLCAELLTEKQCPVHVDELVELLMDHYGRVTDRDSLSSALAKKAKQGVLVRRVSPATFELLK